MRWIPVDEVPPPRYCHTASMIENNINNINNTDHNDDDEAYMVMYGGVNTGVTYLNDTYILYMGTLRWRRLHPSSSPPPRAYHSSSVVRIPSPSNTGSHPAVIIFAGFDGIRALRDAWMLPLHRCHDPPPSWTRIRGAEDNNDNGDGSNDDNALSYGDRSHRPPSPVDEDHNNNNTNNTNNTNNNNIRHHHHHNNTSTALPPIPTSPAVSPRWGHTAVTFRHRYIIVFGGHDGHSRGTTLGDVQVFDTITQAWLSSLRIGGRAFPAPRSRHKAVMLAEGRMVVFGGVGSDLRSLNDVWILHTPGILRRQASPFVWWERGIIPVFSPVPEPRNSHSATAIGDSMVVFGGSRGGKLNEVWRLNVRWMEWTREDHEGHRSSPPPSLRRPGIPLPRWGHTACACDGRVVMFGGNSSIGIVSELHILDPGPPSRFRQQVASLFDPPALMPGMGRSRKRARSNDDDLVFARKRRRIT